MIHYHIIAHTYLAILITTDDILQLLECVVTIATLMETQSPVGRHDRSTYDLQILADDGFRLRSKKEVKVKNTFMY